MRPRGMIFSAAALLLGCGFVRVRCLRSADLSQRQAIADPALHPDIWATRSKRECPMSIRINDHRNSDFFSARDLHTAPSKIFTNGSAMVGVLFSHPETNFTPVCTTEFGVPCRPRRTKFRKRNRQDLGIFHRSGRRHTIAGRPTSRPPPGYRVDYPLDRRPATQGRQSLWQCCGRTGEKLRWQDVRPTTPTVAIGPFVIGPDKKRSSCWLSYR